MGKKTKEKIYYSIIAGIISIIVLTPSLVIVEVLEHTYKMFTPTPLQKAMAVKPKMNVGILPAKRETDKATPVKVWGFTGKKPPPAIWIQEVYSALKHWRTQVKQAYEDFLSKRLVAHALAQQAKNRRTQDQLRAKQEKALLKQLKQGRARTARIQKEKKQQEKKIFLQQQKEQQKLEKERLKHMSLQSRIKKRAEEEQKRKEKIAQRRQEEQARITAQEEKRKQEKIARQKQIEEKERKKQEEKRIKEKKRAQEKQAQKDKALRLKAQSRAAEEKRIRSKQQASALRAEQIKEEEIIRQETEKKRVEEERKSREKAEQRKRAEEQRIKKQEEKQKQEQQKKEHERIAREKEALKKKQTAQTPVSIPQVSAQKGGPLDRTIHRTKLIDSMEESSLWMYRCQEQTIGRLALYKGVSGKGIALYFNLAEHGWLSIQRSFSIDTTAYKGIRFSCLGTGSSNTLEVTVTNDKGNQWGKVIRTRSLQGEGWEIINMFFSEFKPIAPTTKRIKLSVIAALKFAVRNNKGDAGGKGRVVLDNLELIQ